MNYEQAGFGKYNFDDYLDMQNQEHFEIARRESLDTTWREHEVPRTPGWAFADEGDAGASSSRPPIGTQTEPDVTDESNSSNNSEEQDHDNEYGASCIHNTRLLIYFHIVYLCL